MNRNISPRESFDRSQQKLLDQVLVLGSMVEVSVQSALQSLQRRDFAAARAIYAADQRVNEKRYALEQDCITLIATQQPMARDARFLAAVLEIITELERIGDYAKGICKINLLMGEEPVDPAVMLLLQKMADLGLDMLRRSLDAFINQDITAARAIPNEDDQVDNLYNQVYRMLLERMIISPISIDRGNHLMWAAHNLERMADRVSNICERIVYVNTGLLRELESFDDLGEAHE
ncbi:MAG: phosphate signaling complex protein PhoU [Anaerolineales bacterium]|jgi:phosphate transport system protein|nr:phosphate signaling complex protein PhoU [Anaerolineales bacterium]